MSRPRLPVRLSGLPVRLKHHNSAPSSSSNPPSRSSSPKPGNSMANQQGQLVLKVKVLRGRDLAPKDKGNTSDPYLVLTLGDAREATSAVHKTLNPEWNQTFEMPISGVQNMLLEGICWDKDRFGKDYMGEFECAVEDIFANGQLEQEPKWYPLQSKRTGKKSSVVTGAVQLQFSLHDPKDSSASAVQVLQKLQAVFGSSSPPLGEEELGEFDRVECADLEEGDEDLGASEEDAKTPESVERRKRKQRLLRIKKKVKQRGYEFTNGSSLAGVLFLEIQKITDLPPERNVTRTSFDMDPFVVTSLGRRTFRTRCIRHNLNPVYDEKLVFQVMRHEVNYSITFSVVDRDQFSGNDHVGTVSLPLEEVISAAPEADPETGIYKLPEPGSVDVEKKKRFRLPLSRSSSSQSLNKMGKPSLLRENSGNSLSPSLTHEEFMQPPLSAPPTSVPSNYSSDSQTTLVPTTSEAQDDPGLKSFVLPLILRNKDRWEDKHKPTLYIRAKYLPYRALRQQFWRALLKQYDADDSGTIDKVELTTMLDTLGSTLHESTIDSFFQRFPQDNPSAGELPSLSFDEAIICLEDELQKEKPKSSWLRPGGNHNGSSLNLDDCSEPASGTETPTHINIHPGTSAIPAVQLPSLGQDGEEGVLLENDLAEDGGEEHLIEIRECPICHQPRLNKRSAADIITHIATCASQDWRQVNNLVMAGFVTQSQAQRKWYSKVITKISYGGYKVGANSANILVQDRITGQINEERMSVYVRLGIRLLYKGLKANNMEKKRIKKTLKSLSIKQGMKYDDPASAAQIIPFINFHQLDMSEVLKPIAEFKNFNEFFYRELKPGARPPDAPDRPQIVTSPADCRSVVFNTLEDAQRIWVKGREFTVERLLGSAYPEDAKRYIGGAFGIFRLAPQDYHRFHIPVDGVMGEPRLIPGEYYTVNPMAIRSTLDVYGENIRVCVPIDSQCHGRVMVVCVGAMMVGSTVITRKAGEHVHRAEELGYFKFGGSTLLLLFEPGQMRWDKDLVDNSMASLETLIRVGMSIGHSPDHPPHTPDMKKGGPSLEEKQEAKRRIEGSLAPDKAPQSLALQLK